MKTTTDVIRGLMTEIVQSRRDVILIACQQRAKFEGWLKFELAISLAHSSEVTDVVLEDGYPNGGRSDISFLSNNTKWFIEMKTMNTNWRAEGLENLHRPVTKNVDGIIDDIRVLQQKCPPAKGMMVFVIFPVPVYLWKQNRELLRYHLRRIEAETSIQMDSMMDTAEFIQLTNHFGICSFVIEVV